MSEMQITGAKKLITITTLICLLAITSGTLMLLHTHSCSDHICDSSDNSDQKDHDPKDCFICYQLKAMVKIVITPPADIRITPALDYPNAGPDFYKDFNFNQRESSRPSFEQINLIIEISARL